MASHQPSMTSQAARFLVVSPLLFLSPALAFTAFPHPRTLPGSDLRTSTFVPSANRLWKTQHNVGLTPSEEGFNPQGLVPLTKDNTLTPEGFGFTAPAERIVKEAQRANNGYYKAAASESIMNVIDKISENDYDVALVFDEKDNIMGLFTETDYIQVSHLFNFWKYLNVLCTCLSSPYHCIISLSCMCYPLP